MPKPKPAPKRAATKGKPRKIPIKGPAIMIMIAKAKPGSKPINPNIKRGA